MKNIIFIFGTRPEIIKLAPVILEMKKDRSILHSNATKEYEGGRF